MLHPAAALRSTGMMKEFMENFKKLPIVLKKLTQKKQKKKLKLKHNQQKKEKPEDIQKKLF